MKVRVKLFAVAKELAARDALTVDVPENATIADVRQGLINAVPALSKILPHSLWAIGTEYVTSHTVVTENSDVAMIPPVSGG
jgi:molybdopterin converting factor small subunit